MSMRWFMRQNDCSESWSSPVTTNRSDQSRPLRIATLVKQVPQFEAMTLGPDGRLVRDGLEVEMNPYCRRAVATGVTLAAATGGRCTVLTLGPPSAEDVIREAIAWGADDGVVVTDPAFAGSDTLATARALAAAIAHDGPFDLVLVGRNSVDADTGQVGPQLAELLDLPFLGGARSIEITDGVVHARLEHDDGWVVAETDLPAVISCAERLCEPCKADRAARDAVPGHAIRRLSAADLGPGPWGQAGSPTRVGEIKVHEHSRERRVLTGSAADQVDQAVALLHQRGALGDDSRAGRGCVGGVPESSRDAEPAGPVVVVAEPGRARVSRELVGAAAVLARQSGRTVTAIVPAKFTDLGALGGWGADRVLLIDRSDAADDVVAAIASWCGTTTPWAVLVPSTMWGREVAGRLAARLGAGLTGDATGLDVAGDRLIGWKPAFGGQLVAAITADTPIQMATVRPGVLPVLEPRASVPPPVETVPAERSGRVRRLDGGRDDNVDLLAAAPVVVGVGMGVDHRRYDELDTFLATIRGTLAATRKVTDNGWLPRSRQIGITGRSIQPELYIAIGSSGRFNHTVGFRAATTVLAINPDPVAPIFEVSDIGIVGDWAEIVPLLTDALAGRMAAAG
jgi:electron transfer flavoprotein alpha subunit